MYKKDTNVGTDFITELKLEQPYCIEFGKHAGYVNLIQSKHIPVKYGGSTFAELKNSNF